MQRFPRFELECIDGVVRTFAGCSVVGVLEFNERIEQIFRRLEKLPDGSTLERAYYEDRELQYWVNRALELNGVQPDWVRWDMINAMLLGRIENGQPRPGFLVELNAPRPAKDDSDSGEPISSEAMAIAAIATYCGVEEAIRLAQAVPANQLWEILSNYGELSKSPEQRAKEKEDNKRRAWQAERRAKHEAMMRSFSQTAAKGAADD